VLEVMKHMTAIAAAGRLSCLASCTFLCLLLCPYTSLAQRFKKIAHGKFQSLASRGRFEYGFAQSGLKTLFDHNWLGIFDKGFRGTWTTTVSGGLGVGFPRDFTVQVATKPGAFETVATLTDCAIPDEDGLSVDLYTVIGYPNVRYVRLVATRLGQPGIGEPGAFRLQLSRLRLLRP